MQAIINFYNEKIKTTVPSTYEALKKKISEFLYVKMEDVNEMQITSRVENKEKEIKTEEDYKNVLKNKKEVEIEVKIKDNSQLFKKEEKNLMEKIYEKVDLKTLPQKLTTNIKNAYQFIGNFVEPYVKPIGDFISQKLKKKEDEKLVHKNYICDGCEKGPITGIRYKCTVCEDFDYCEECEAKLGEKHGHPFLKIRKPEMAPAYIHCSYPTIKGS